MLAFQKYQLEFTAHLRDPITHAKPAGVNDAGMAVYREIVFNNIFATASACFPVCRAILGKRAWLKLAKQFFAAHQASTPIFREIPQEFLKFLDVAKNLPSYNLPIYLGQLAHYEWVELAVSLEDVKTPKLSKKLDFLHEKPMLAPAHMLLAYDFPVHKISKRFKPTVPEAAYLLVYRHVDFKVKFIELNPVTYQLLQLIQQNKLTGEQALMQLAADIQHPDAQAVIQFGAEILADLASQGAIIGSY